MPRLSDTPMGRAARGRAGFTLAELLIVIVLVGIIGAALTRVINRQQKFYRGVNEVMDTRMQIRQVTQALPFDIRGVSSVGGDILSVSDSALELRINIGSGIICAMPSMVQIELPSVSSTAGQQFTSFSEMPKAGDIAFVYDDGVTKGSVDDVWQEIAVASDTDVGTGYCTGTTYLAPSDAGRNRYRLNLAANINGTVQIGAPVRVVRKARYSLYQAANGKWYLGFAEWNGGSYDAPSPVSGPFTAYGPTGVSGLELRYYDELGNAVTTGGTLSSIARIGLAVRSASAAIDIEGLSRGAHKDSLAVTIAIRNR